VRRLLRKLSEVEPVPQIFIQGLKVSKIFKASQQLRRYADANWQGVGSNMEPGRMY